MKDGKRNTAERTPRVFAPQELVFLEQFLRHLREASPNKLDTTFVPATSIVGVVARYHAKLPEFHSFVRGMIYGL